MAVARPRPRPVRPGRPRLTVIPGGRLHRRAPGVRFVVLASLIIAVLVFGLVLLHITLAQSSFELHRVHGRVVEEEDRYRRMRYEIARAESPAKVAQAAAAAGLVVPEEQRYLITSSAVAEGPPAEPGGEGLKAVLSKQP